MHLADLHIGKRIHAFSMLEDQTFILDQIIDILKREKISTLLIAGDVYDKSIPTNEAITLFDDFLVRVFRENIRVFIISGNHDSPERLAFASRIFESCQIYISQVYQKAIAPTTLRDEFGEIDFWLIPFLKPADVRRFYPDQKIESYTDAMRVVIKNLQFTPGRRNVALVHQFITDAKTCDSEEHAIGGLDNIDADIFAPFQYVALGHLHGPQSVTRETIRYAGSPLIYSFSESRHVKSATIVALEDEVRVHTLPLEQPRQWRELEGTYAELTSEHVRNDNPPLNFYQITLTDKDRIPGAADVLRKYYPLCMSIEYASQREIILANSRKTIAQKTPIAYFEELFSQKLEHPMRDEEKKIVDELIREIWDDKTP